MNRRGFFGALAGLAGALAFWRPAKTPYSIDQFLKEEGIPPFPDIPYSIPDYHGIRVEYRAGQEKGPRYLWCRTWKGDQSQVREVTFTAPNSMTVDSGDAAPQLISDESVWDQPSREDMER